MASRGARDGTPCAANAGSSGQQQVLPGEDVTLYTRAGSSRSSSHRWTLDCTETRWPQLLVLQPAAAPSQDGAGGDQKAGSPWERQDSLGSRPPCRTGHTVLGTPLLPPGLRRSFPLPPRSLPCSGSDLPGLWRLLQPFPLPLICRSARPWPYCESCTFIPCVLIQSCCGTRSPILSFPRLGRSGAARWFSLSHRGTQGRVQPRPNLFFSSGDALPLGSSDSSSLPVSPTGGRCGSRLLRLDTGGSHSTSSPCSVARLRDVHALLRRHDLGSGPGTVTPRRGAPGHRGLSSSPSSPPPPPPASFPPPPHPLPLPAGQHTCSTATVELQTVSGAGPDGEHNTHSMS